MNLTVLRTGSNDTMPNRVTIGAAGAIASLALVWACSGPDHGNPNRTVSTPGQFVDGSWQFRIDRSWVGESHYPRDPLAEAEYQAFEKAPVYPILVLEHGSRIIIGTQHEWTRSLHFPLKGTRTLSTEFVAYDLREGTPAGGRFLVWLGDRGLQGELTIYGSGVPIVSSERGIILREP